MLQKNNHLLSYTCAEVKLFIFIFSKFNLGRWGLKYFYLHHVQSIYFSCRGFLQINGSSLAQQRGRVIAIINLRYLFFLSARVGGCVPLCLKLQLPRSSFLLGIIGPLDVESEMTNGTFLMGS